jgi:hypothetical protein
VAIQIAAHDPALIPLDVKPRKGRTTGLPMNPTTPTVARPIGAAGVSWTSYVSVFKRCSALCTASDFTEPRYEDSQ